MILHYVTSMIQRLLAPAELCSVEPMIVAAYIYQGTMAPTEQSCGGGENVNS